MSTTGKKTLIVTLTLFGVMVCAAAASLAIGAVAVPFSSIVSFLTGSMVSDEHRTILLSIRLPRVLLAMVAGGGLSVAGAVFQALLRNPLAEPYILGISSGGTVGAVLAIGLGAGFSLISVPLASFAGSLVVMVLVYTIATRYGKVDPTTLLLAGVMVGAFFQAIILLLVTLLHQEVRHAFLWLMGNLSSATFSRLAVVAPVVILASGCLYLLSPAYNVVATGDEAAAHLGIHVEYVRRLSYILASLITGFIVSISGVIGFVGLLIPHIGRLVFGYDHRVLLPASFFLGATFLMLVDVISRTLISPAEIPVGTVTAALGAPVFIWLLRKKD